MAVSAPPAVQRAIAVRNVSKAFGAIRALSDVSIDVHRGEVHGLVGANGSGKSTLVKSLAGYHVPDGGTVEVWGRDVRLPISDPNEHGIAIIHQDLGLVDELSVTENIVASTRFGTTGARPISWRRQRDRAQALLDRLEIDVDPDRMIGDIGRGERTLVAVARAICELDAFGGDHLLITDEPTAALSSSEAGALWNLLRRVTAGGGAAIFISHHLREVREQCDRVTVLRDGAVVQTSGCDEIDEDAIVALMLGTTGDDVQQRRSVADVAERASSAGPPALALRDLSYAGPDGDLHGVDFTVAPGEIVGVTGLLGMGHDLVPYVVAGQRGPYTGTVSAGAQPLRAGDPHAALDAGFALVPAERQRDGLWLEGTIAENLGIVQQRRFWRRGRYDRALERERADAVAGRFGVWPPTRRGWSTRSAAATSRRCCWPSGCSSSRGSCCSTSPPRASTSPRRRRSTGSCGRSPTARGPPCDLLVRSRRDRRPLRADPRDVAGPYLRRARRHRRHHPDPASSERRPMSSETSAPPAPGVRPRSAPQIRENVERFGLVFVLIALIGLFGLVLPGTFLTSTNLTVTLSGQAAILILALAVTLPLRAGDFDLSVGMVMIGTAAIIAVLTTRHGFSLGPAILVAFAAALCVGLLNATLIVGIGIDAFIVTLGTMTLLGGLIIALTGGDVITGLPSGLTTISNTDVLGSIPSRVFLGWLLLLAIWYVYEFTPFGRRLLFTGGNREAARLSGIKVGRVRTTAFVSASLIAAFAGVLLAGALGAVDPVSGHAYLLQPYAAAFLGTTVIQFRRFNAIGTVIGVYLLAVGVSGLQLLGVDAWVSDVFNGAVLIVAVMVATIMRRESLGRDLRRLLRRPERPAAPVARPTTEEATKISRSW